MIAGARGGRNHVFFIQKVLRSQQKLMFWLSLYERFFPRRFASPCIWQPPPESKQLASYKATVALLGAFLICVLCFNFVFCFGFVACVFVAKIIMVFLVEGARGGPSTKN